MKLFNHSFALVCCLFILLVSACKNEKPTVENEEETITTVQLKFTPVGGGQSIDFKYQDVDGNGANPPIYTTDLLDSNTNYTVQVTLLNEASNPVENITDEVQSEGVDHQFFYMLQPTSIATFQYNDKDDNGDAIGISTLCQTKGKSEGKLKVILRHKPNKKAMEVSVGDITNAGGETDIEVEFDFKIK